MQISAALAGREAAAEQRREIREGCLVRCFYDAEFLEDGRTIELISIGIVTDSGREYYAVNSGIDETDDSRRLHGRIGRHEWLMANVVPNLPLVKPPTRFDGHWLWSLDKRSTLVRPSWVIANEVRDFILGTDPSGEVPYVELWADYAAYDHVALCQLWGPMIRLPEGIPMWTHDLRQVLDHYGMAKEVPSMPGVTEHNALSDAREVKFRYEWLAARTAAAS
jgi:3' exoribonuclease, RNase T-like